MGGALSLPFGPLLAQATDPAAQVDTVWRLQTHWSWAPWVTALALMAIVATVVVCYRLETSPAGALYRGLLTLLRLTTVGLLLLMLSEAVFSGARTGKPRMAIVLDRSGSMQTIDAEGEGLAGPVSREEAARGVLLADDARLLHRLEEGFELQFALVDSAVEVTDGSADELARLVADRAAGPDPSSTRLGDALGSLLDAPASAPLQGVLLLTDGQATAGRPLADAAEGARRAGASLYFLGVGAETAPPDARLTDLVADETAFVDDLVRFQATLRTRGLEGRRIRVELFREGNAAPVASETLTVGPDAPRAADGATDSPAEGAGQPVRLLDRPTEPGEHRYTLRATLDGVSPGPAVPPPSELTHTLSVRDDPVRVLLAAGYPNYEYRYLKHLLERDQTVRVSTHLQESDLEYTESDLTAIARFPLRASELDEYEVIVLIDLDPTLLPRSLWDVIGEFVSDKGGGLALVAGPRSLPAAYRGREAFAALSPTDLAATPGGGWDDPAGFQVSPTELGRLTPSLELADTPADSERVWRGLPGLYWRADVGPPKPAARVLAHLPGAELVAGKPAPLIVSHYYGAGRVLLHAVDSTWRWRFRVGDVYFARYWVQTIRDLARGRRSSAAQGVELASTRARYEPGEPVRLRLSDQRPESSSETARTVTLQTAGRPDRRVELSPGAGGRGRFQATLNALPAGRYRAVFAAGEKPAVAEFEVVAPPGEAANPQMNRDGMTAAAERTRGAFFTIDQAERLLASLPRARPAVLESLPPIELWNRWPLLLAVTACLTAEWILRKRQSML